MKKTYSIPEMENLLIETQQVLAASPLSIFTDEVNGGNALARELDEEVDTYFE